MSDGDGGKCKRCGCACDGPLCAYCTLDRERFMRARDEREAKKKAGLCCRSCGCEEMPVYYSRRAFGRIRRVRKCRHCGRKVVTWESDE